MKVILDAEFDSLTPTKVWCVSIKEVESGLLRTFRADSSSSSSSLSGFVQYCTGVSCFIGHHIVGFDAPELNRLLDAELIDWRKCIDTLVVSRLVDFSKRGGHGVENWSKDFKLHKPEIKVYDDPSMIEEYVRRCEADVEIQYRIYKELLPHINNPSLRPALRVEHDMAYICRDMQENGFAFNKGKAEELLEVISTRMVDLETKIRESVPLVLKQDGAVKLKKNKDGSTSLRTMDIHQHDDFDYVSDAEFHRFHHEPFNPASTKERVELLNKCGWKPVEKTKGHLECERNLRQMQWKVNRAPNKQRKMRLQREAAELKTRLERFRVYGWKCNEVNLDTLPSDAPLGATYLAQWLTLEGRRSDLVEWLAAYHEGTGRLHGNFNGLGAWSHRMSHSAPNAANIFSSFELGNCKDKDNPTPVEHVKLDYNNILRGLWVAPEGRLLVGTDAEGIQLRVLAHLINDKAFTAAIEKGDKKLGTDVHSYNRSLLGPVCRSRDDAKTFIYAWLLGAGVAKVAEILGCSIRDASQAMDLFLSSIPGLRGLRERDIPSDARRGFFIGLDGRRVNCSSEHLMLSGYLQNGEAVVMKHANVAWRRRLDRVWYRQCNFVHDEWVTEARTEEEAKYIGEIQAEAIRATGERLGMRCALAGEYKVGTTWLEVH